MSLPATTRPPAIAIYHALDVISPVAAAVPMAVADAIIKVVSP